MHCGFQREDCELYSNDLDSIELNTYYLYNHGPNLSLTTYSVYLMNEPYKKPQRPTQSHHYSKQA